MATTTYKTTRTTRVVRANPAAKLAAKLAPITLSVAIPAPGVLQIQGVHPDALLDRLPHVIRLLTRK